MKLSYSDSSSSNEESGKGCHVPIYWQDEREDEGEEEEGEEEEEGGGGGGGGGGGEPHLHYLPVINPQGNLIQSIFYIQSKLSWSFCCWSVCYSQPIQAVTETRAFQKREQNHNGWKVALLQPMHQEFYCTACIKHSYPDTQWGEALYVSAMSGEFC